MIMGIEFNIKFFIKLGFGVAGIYLIYIWGYVFGLGILWGMSLIGYMFLFPSDNLVRLLDSMFNYSKSLTVVMKNESEKNKSRINKENFERKVKFGRFKD